VGGRVSRGFPLLERRTIAPLAFAGSAGLIVYTFAGYPAIMALMARIRSRPVGSDPAFRPRLSFIILAHNEEDVIEAKLANTLALDYPRDRLEVLVVADGSDDATARLAAGVGGVRVLHRAERRGKLAAMMRGAREASGDVLVFSDANNSYSKDALLVLAACFADREVGVVTGRKAIDDGSGRPLDRAEGLYWRYESKLKEWESACGSVLAAAGEILAFRREAFPELPFNALTEDMLQILAAAAAGWRVVYAREAISLEPASATLRDESTRRARLVAGRWQVAARMLPRLVVRRPRLAWQLASHKLTRPLIPAALLGLALSNQTLAARHRWARGFGAAQAGFYLAAMVGWRDELAGRRSRPTYLAYYFCRMNAAALAGPLSLLTRRQSVAWKRVQRG
jgi:cellulose synthase/poly-beta-1,6-N-acetylglucosamine synthase-like glycosyltransferase